MWKNRFNPKWKLKSNEGGLIFDVPQNATNVSNIYFDTPITGIIFYATFIFNPYRKSIVLLGP